MVMTFDLMRRARSRACARDLARGFKKELHASLDSLDARD
jgi:hypothetical protein